MKNVLPTLLFILSMFFAGQTCTASQNEPAIVSPSPATAVAATGNLIFHGTVERHEQGTALNTSKGVFPLLGGDFDMIIGREVKIIGKVITEGNIEKIAVARVQIAKP